MDGQAVKHSTLFGANMFGNNSGGIGIDCILWHFKEIRRNRKIYCGLN